MVAVDCRDNNAIKMAKDMFVDWKLKNITVPQNLRRVVYSTGVRSVVFASEVEIKSKCT